MRNVPSNLSVIQSIVSSVHSRSYVHGPTLDIPPIRGYPFAAMSSNAAPPTHPPKPQAVLQTQGAGLGTFGGVFTPSILTILGVIMYLRFGWVVGNVGLLGTLLIVTIATSITFLTALSISAIASDQRVRVGGAYYMISRSLGIETGGAVGIPLFFAQALSVALYTIGFAESIVNVFPALDQRIVGLVTTIAVAALALTSARAAIRAQLFIMAAIGISLLSFFFGHPIGPAEHDALTAPVGDVTRHGFWVVFAVFFPAVTGIMSGVNMSGDLKEPGKSIPRGTMAAVGVGFLIYMTLPVFLAERASSAELIADPMSSRWNPPRPASLAGQGQRRGRHAQARNDSHAGDCAHRRVVWRPESDRADSDDVLSHDLWRAERVGWTRARPGKPILPTPIPGTVVPVCAGCARLRQRDDADQRGRDSDRRGHCDRDLCLAPAP